MALERLQKIIAAAGIASRRKAEELIQQGLVSVNGKTVTELGTKADLESDSIRVNEKLLKGAERHEYVALNKPRGYVTTVSDPEGRPTVMELIRSKARLYPVGRLDFNSEGLLLLTNDGDLAHKLMKAASNIPKTYLVKVAGQPEEGQLRRLRAGVSIAEERNPSRRVRTAAAQIRVIKEADNPWLEVTLHEGRNRQIRKMFEEIGHHVEKIRRVRYGPLELDLPPGESRVLSLKEVAQLQRATVPQIQTLKTRDRDSFRSKRDERPRRFERPSADGGSGKDDRDWKKRKVFNKPPRDERVTQNRDFNDRRDRPRPEGEVPRFERPEARSKTGSARFSKGKGTDSQFRERTAKFGPRKDRGERKSASSQFGGRSRSGGSKSRDQNRNRGPNRFRER